jgi:hypothetical protein
MSELLQTKTIEEIKQELGSVKASQILRNVKVEQLFGDFSNGRGKFCALGAIYEFFGWNGGTNDSTSNWKPADFEILVHSLGLTEADGIDIIQMNDMGHYTFEEISKELESRNL